MEFLIYHILNNIIDSRTLFMMVNFYNMECRRQLNFREINIKLILLKKVKLISENRNNAKNNFFFRVF